MISPALVRGQSVADAALERLLLVREVEEFLFEESDAIDTRAYERWLGFFSDDIRYWVPIRKNLAFKDRDREIGGDRDVAWFDDDKRMLIARVAQIKSGVHWAEEPLSRVTHFVTNVLLDGDFEDSPGAELSVRSHFMVYRNRMSVETDLLAGRREDVLRRTPDGGFLICRRKVILDQATLTAKNLSFFL